MNLDNFTLITQKSLKQGSQIANIQKHQQIENGHILKGIFTVDKTISSYLLKKCGIDVVVLEDLIDKIISSYVTLYSGKLSISSHVEKTLNAAKELSARLNDNYISIEHLLYGMVTSNDGVAALMNNKGANPERIVDAIRELRSGLINTDIEIPLPYTKRLTDNLLEKVSDASYLPLYHRTDKIKEFMSVLSRMNGKCPVLVGEPGSGKTSLVENLALSLMQANVPANLLNRPLLQLKSFSLLYEPSPRESMLKLIEELVESDKNPILFVDDSHLLFESLKEAGLNDIIVLLYEKISRDAIQLIFSTTPDGFQEIFDKPHLVSTLTSPLFIETPDEETAIRILKKSRDLLEVYHQILINNQAIEALVYFASKYFPEQQLPGSAITLLDKAAATLKHEINILPQEIEELENEINTLKLEQEQLDDKEQAKEYLQKISNLSDKRNKLKASWEDEKKLFAEITNTKKELYLLRRKAEKDNLQNNFASLSEIKNNSYPKTEKKLATLVSIFKELSGSSIIYNRVIDADYISAFVANETGISVKKMEQTNDEKIIALYENLQNKIVGQEKALKLIASAIKRNYTNVSRNKAKALGRFIFAGAQSYGKKATAKTIAKLLFDNENNYHRINLSLFEGCQKPIDSFKEYLYKTVDRHDTKMYPFKTFLAKTVLLFDNFENAPVEIQQCVEQIFSSSILSYAGKGVLKFHQSVLIINNWSKQEIHKPTSADDRIAIRQSIYKELNTSNMSLLTDKADDVIVFYPFGFNEIYKLVAIQFAAIKLQLQQSDIEIEITKSALSWLAKAAYAPGNGGRVVKKVLNHYISNQLADLILSGSIEKDKSIIINCDNKGITLQNIEKDKIKEEMSKKVNQNESSPSNDIIQKFQITNTITEESPKENKLNKVKNIFSRKKN